MASRRFDPSRPGERVVLGSSPHRWRRHESASAPSTERCDATLSSTPFHASRPNSGTNSRPVGRQSGVSAALRRGRCTLSLRCAAACRVRAARRTVAVARPANTPGGGVSLTPPSVPAPAREIRSTTPSGWRSAQLARSPPETTRWRSRHAPPRRRRGRHLASTALAWAAVETARQWRCRLRQRAERRSSALGAPVHHGHHSAAGPAPRMARPVGQSPGLDGVADWFGDSRSRGRRRRSRQAIRGDRGGREGPNAGPSTPLSRGRGLEDPPVRLSTRLPLRSRAFLVRYRARELTAARRAWGADLGYGLGLVARSFKGIGMPARSDIAQRRPRKASLRCEAHEDHAHQPGPAADDAQSDREEPRDRTNTPARRSAPPMIKRVSPAHQIRPGLTRAVEGC